MQAGKKEAVNSLRETNKSGPKKDCKAAIGRKK